MEKKLDSINKELAEKNKDYEMRYAKYQSLENEYNNVEELNQELQREQKLLEQRISNFEIHTEGD